MPTPTKTNTTASTNLGSEVQRLFGNDFSVIKKAKSTVPENYSRLSEEEKSVTLATFIFEVCC